MLIYFLAKMVITFLFNLTTTFKRLKGFKYFNCNLIILRLSVTHPVTFKNYNAANIMIFIMSTNTNTCSRTL